MSTRHWTRRGNHLCMSLTTLGSLISGLLTYNLDALELMHFVVRSRGVSVPRFLFRKKSELMIREPRSLCHLSFISIRHYQSHVLIMVLVKYRYISSGKFFIRLWIGRNLLAPELRIRSQSSFEFMFICLCDQLARCFRGLLGLLLIICLLGVQVDLRLGVYAAQLIQCRFGVIRLLLGDWFFLIWWFWDSMVISRMVECWNSICPRYRCHTSVLLWH